MKLIPLTKNTFAIVDDEDFDLVSQWYWHLSVGGYAARTVDLVGQPKHTIFMHNLITSCPKDKVTDHIDGLRLNNCRSNLRICETYQNHFNIAVRYNNKSGYKGVSWRPSKNKWRVRICVRGKDYSLGHFSNKEDAIKAYREAEIKHFGEYRRIKE